MWLLGKHSSTTDSGVSEATPAQKQRSKQISWLSNEVTGVVEVERDLLYRVNFVVEGATLSLDISLSSRFPLEGPRLVVSPPVRHPWVDTQMVIFGSPLVQHFGPHSNLGKAVLQVIREFQEHPPELLPVHTTSNMAAHPTPPYPTPSLPHLSPDATPGSYTYSSVPSPVASESVDHPSTSPSARPAFFSSSNFSSSSLSSASSLRYQIPDTLPGISEMSEEELDKFLNDEDAVVMIDKFISQLDVINKVQQQMEDVFQFNEKQARANLDMEPALQERWEHLQDKVLEIQTKKNHFDKLSVQQTRLLERYDRKKAPSRLHTLAQDVDTESEVSAEDFICQKMDFVEFSQKYLHQRKMYHSRASKVELLKYQRT